MVSARETTPSVLELIKIARELILVVKMSKKLKKPLKNQAYIPFVQLFSINLLSTFGECGGTFGICQHDYDVCNDDKREC
jgi:hypothetical protein